VDYAYVLRTFVDSLFIRRPPVPLKTDNGKVPILMIQGLYNRWNSMRSLAEHLSKNGYPVYLLPQLGRNSGPIPAMAGIVRKFIAEKGLQNIIIIGHSKGGLVGKCILDNEDGSVKIKKLIAIACPFQGSRAAVYLPTKSHAELTPSSPMIAKLSASRQNNGKITSIYCKFDNHVWPLSSCILPGAKNIQTGVYGHHRILFDKTVRDIVLSEISNF